MEGPRRRCVAAALFFVLAAGRPARAQGAARPGRSQPSLAAGGGGIRWVRIPGGKFTMGADDLGPYARPRHEVTVRAFQMAKTLVTNKQYKACMAAGACAAATPQGAPYDGDDQPVVGVDWNQAKAFSAWVGGRLPTEAEWEYAARGGGRNQKYPWGDEDATCRRAVISGCGGGTAPVCSKPAGNTRQGLCDMAGNAQEWVEDSWHDSYAGAPADGGAWEGEGSAKVNRGGSWSDGAASARSASRDCYAPGDRYSTLGFRPVR